MNQNNRTGGRSQSEALSTLRQFVRARAPVERCEICSTPLWPEHPHLFEPTSRQIICACAECDVSIGNQSGTKYRRIPERVRFLADFNMSDGQWDSLLIPVGMAFFFYSSPAEKMMAYYPSPAGATESLLSFETWGEVVGENPILRELEPDVQALLVYRLKGVHEYYLAPIDKCFELVGLIRMNWKGLSGGTEVWTEIASFFARLKLQAGAYISA